VDHLTLPDRIRDTSQLMAFSPIRLLYTMTPRRISTQEPVPLRDRGSSAEAIQTTLDTVVKA
jgi:hypothetical protein